jgi:hypothetical protein
MALLLGRTWFEATILEAYGNSKKCLRHPSSAGTKIAEPKILAKAYESPMRIAL